MPRSPQAAVAVPAHRLEISPRRGLRREEAARYVGVGSSKFDEMERDGRMPKPKRIDGCAAWTWPGTP